MEVLRVEEIVSAMQVKLINTSADLEITGVSIDSRIIKPGDMFSLEGRKL